MLRMLSWNLATTHYPSHVGELEQIEDPINASDMLKWIEESDEVAESVRVNEDLVCRLSPTHSRVWMYRFCVSTIMSTVYDVCAENSVSL